MPDSWWGTLGDRPTSDGKTARECQFLGAPATFPIGAIVIAAMMHCPVILFFAFIAGQSPRNLFLKFADEIVLNREHRAEDGPVLDAARYVDRLDIISPDLALATGSTLSIPSGIDICGSRHQAPVRLNLVEVRFAILYRLVRSRPHGANPGKLSG